MECAGWDRRGEVEMIEVMNEVTDGPTRGVRTEVVMMAMDLGVEVIAILRIGILDMSGKGGFDDCGLAQWSFKE